jgi:hypothetical protein
MPAQIYSEEHRNWASGKIVAVAKSILSGELGIVAGARQLAAWRFCFKPDALAEPQRESIFSLARAEVPL